MTEQYPNYTGDDVKCPACQFSKYDLPLWNIRRITLKHLEPELEHITTLHLPNGLILRTCRRCGCPWYEQVPPKNSSATPLIVEIGVCNGCPILGDCKASVGNGMLDSPPSDCPLRSADAVMRLRADKRGDDVRKGDTLKVSDETDLCVGCTGDTSRWSLIEGLCISEPMIGRCPTCKRNAMRLALIESREEARE